MLRPPDQLVCFRVKATISATPMGLVDVDFTDEIGQSPISGDFSLFSWLYFALIGTILNRAEMHGATTAGCQFVALNFIQ